MSIRTSLLREKRPESLEKRVEKETPMARGVAGKRGARLAFAWSWLGRLGSALMCWWSC